MVANSAYGSVNAVRDHKTDDIPPKMTILSTIIPYWLQVYDIESRSFSVANYRTLISFQHIHYVKLKMFYLFITG